MLIVEAGKEQEAFLTFIEKAVSKLAAEDYAGFIAAFDESRLAEENTLQISFVKSEHGYISSLEDLHTL